ncbi:Beta-glucosidase 24 [Glycine soja]
MMLTQKMDSNGYLVVGVVAFALLCSFRVSLTDSVPLFSPVHDAASLTRNSFPAGFIFGAGSSAYQFEGAAKEGGRGPSIWDTFTHNHPEKIRDGANGDVAVDQYHRYKEDVKIMKDMNLDSYRFSISWPRILPKGKLSGGVNQEGINYYNNLINELLANGVLPYVTLFHWDLPQALEDEYGGFLSSHIVDDFQDYADLCFKEFGDRVKFWTTLNEPWLFSQGGYATGATAPGRCTGPQCLGGDAGTEPYIVTHNQILAHAAAVHVYKTKYQAHQKGKIGITYMEPLTKGEYPKNMRALVGSRLPKFTKWQAKLVNGSFDFIGLNYYSSGYINGVPPSNDKPNFLTDSRTNTSFERNGRPLGLRAASVWIYFYPRGLLDLLLYTKEKYNNPLIYITENDVGIMKDMNLDAYRFSISWSRILPNYADLCFKEFGDRVKHWITLNEPWSYSQHGYATGEMAPGRCSAWMNPNCNGGDSATEPYLVSHHQLLAHAASVHVYKTKYQTFQNGLIGITLNVNWYVPFSDNKLDHKATERAIDFQKMACNGFCLRLIALVLVISISSVNCIETDAVEPIIDIASLNRDSFPPDFIFGAGSSSYQCLVYNNINIIHEDVKIVKDMNLDSYRFSISWSRILPKGKLSRGINQEGIDYYNNLINELVANGIQPLVTLFHWDLPQSLEDEYGGFLSPRIVKDFRDYAELCFKEFGDRVKYWVTLNEPWSYSQHGYANGGMAPGRCSAWVNPNCTGGDSGTEPYLVTHYQLLAHAAAVRVYKTKYQVSQKGLIGITLVANWYLPFSNTKADQKATERAIDFMFMDPLTSGDYPKIMRSLVRTRLPKFTTEQSKLLIGSFDFIGLNYYSSTYASDAPHLSNARPNYVTDSLVTPEFERDGKPIGIKIASDWLYVCPRGILDLLLYTKEKYNNPLIYITENGINEFRDETISLEESLLDTFRIDYHYLLVLVRSSKVTCELETDTVSPIIDISLSRKSFPEGFIFGAGSSSYQFEGAAKEGGREPSVWDTFTHNYPEKIMDRSNGDVAIDSYHHYKEDVGMMKDMNLDSYRFSISWSRILPKGKLSGGINREGINYYNNLINELVANGIQPLVTLFHWDLPQALEDEYGGFLSPRIVKDFRDYAELCFKEFGDRVKHWVTLNEPWSYSQNGYANGRMAPGRCSAWMNLNCTGGDSSTEPYLVTHHQLLAHAAVVRVYKTKYQAFQKGVIGITLVANWFLPLRDTKSDQKATERAIDFMFMDPLTSGDYPKSMRSLVRTRLPKFTTEQSKLLIGSFDFIGLNYYSTTYASDSPQLSNARPSYLTDSLIASDWLYVYPRGIRDLLLYTKEKYNNPLIYITENGINEYNEPTLSLEESLMDTFRIDYHYRHLFYLQSAIKNGANVKGYHVWSLFDNFEWSSGYTVLQGKVEKDRVYGILSLINTQEDIGIMKYMNLDAYRFSISWSRVLPKGKLSAGVNHEGVNYYNNLINELMANGLQPYVTLFHWDVPQALEDEYGGFLSPHIVDDFRDYAELCFKEFGNRVKHWITLNEPRSVSKNGYANGRFAPGRCSDWLKLNCTGGDSGTEPYLTSHNQLLAHAAAAKLYKTKYQTSQKGLIGITLNSDWYVPVSKEKSDQDSARRGLDFMYMDPLTKGEYPKTMRSMLGNRLPEFSKEEARQLKGSFDFLGLNYYSSFYAAHAPHQRGARPTLQTDALVNVTNHHDGKPLGPMAASNWLCIYPRGFRQLLLFIKKQYNNPLIYITENGNRSEDIGIMKYMNLDAYRFSIAWSRVLPKGKLSAGVNKEGINYYNNLINELLANGLQPYVTLFHWDVPQALEDEYGGLLSPHIVDDFRDYAELCFKEFGDRVKHWITLNEPSTVSMNGYAVGSHAPGRCSDWLKMNCTGGDSGTEPYLSSHYQLLSHAAAANLYKTKYQTSQKGIIGITLNTDWFLPASEKITDRDAARRALDFRYMDPITFGDYPKSMRSLVGNRLPKFSKEETRQLKGSFDFLGLNHYATVYAGHAPHLRGPRPTLLTDPLIYVTNQRDGRAASNWLCVYPRGLRQLLLYIKKQYNSPVIYITESYDELNDPTLSLEESMIDTYRVDYFYRYLYYLQMAIRDGVNVKGYFVWSLLDNMEWSAGYTVRFGLVFVDYKDGLKRYLKLSAQWFKNFLNKS